LENPETAVRCDCGYNFVNATLTRKSEKKYRNYAEVPWYRTSSTNSALVLFGLFCACSPLIIWTCINLATGDVYYERKDADGYLMTWSFANKIAAFVILALNIVVVLIVLANRLRR